MIYNVYAGAFLDLLVPGLGDAIGERTGHADLLLDLRARRARSRLPIFTSGIFNCCCFFFQDLSEAHLAIGFSPIGLMKNSIQSSDRWLFGRKNL
jgi:hypothetical protein